MSIKVYLDINADPAVTVSPTTENVNEGNQTIEWVPAAQQPDFTFIGLAFPGNSNQFTDLVVDPTQMSVTEFNNNSGDDYPYVIMVSLDGVDYCTVPSGDITGGGDGTPIIHNN